MSFQPSPIDSKEKCHSQNLNQISFKLAEANDEIISAQNLLISQLDSANKQYFSQISQIRIENGEQAKQIKELTNKLQSYERAFCQLNEQQNVKIKVAETKILSLEKALLEKDVELQRSQQIILQKEMQRKNVSDYYFSRLAELNTEHTGYKEELTKKLQNSEETLCRVEDDYKLKIKMRESAIESLHKLLCENDERLVLLEKTILENKKEMDKLETDYLAKITNLLNRNDTNVQEYARQVKDLTKQLEENDDKFRRVEEKHQKEIEAAENNIKSAKSLVCKTNNKVNQLEQTVSKKDIEIENLTCHLKETQEQKEKFEENLTRLGRRVNTFIEYVESGRVPVNWHENDNESTHSTSVIMVDNTDPQWGSFEINVNTLLELTVNKLYTLDEAEEIKLGAVIPETVSESSEENLHPDDEAEDNEEAYEMSESRKRNSSTEPSKSQCPFCQKSYISGDDLQTHMAVNHASDIYEPGNSGNTNKKRKLAVHSFKHSLTNEPSQKNEIGVVNHKNHGFSCKSLGCRLKFNCENDLLIHVERVHLSKIFGGSSR